jgi:hypothetical protein
MYSSCEVNKHSYIEEKLSSTRVSRTENQKHNKMILTNPPDTWIDVQSVSTCTALATTVNAFYNLFLPKLFWYSANTSGGKIVIAWLHAP